METKLIELMKVVLADTYVTYLKAHGYHWNTEGKDFYQMHKLLQKIYEDLQESTDDIGEQIRQIQGRAIHTLLEFDKYRTIPDTAITVPTDNYGMLQDLASANQLLLISLIKAYEEAGIQKEFALQNFIQDRMMASKKHAWMLRSTLNKAGE
jgi:starvation-inducible DNA-binding protein